MSLLFWEFICFSFQVSDISDLNGYETQFSSYDINNFTKITLDYQEFSFPKQLCLIFISDSHFFPFQKLFLVTVFSAHTGYTNIALLNLSKYLLKAHHLCLLLCSFSCKRFILLWTFYPLRQGCSAKNFLPKNNTHRLKTPKTALIRIYWQFRLP